MLCRPMLCRPMLFVGLSLLVSPGAWSPSVAELVLSARGAPLWRLLSHLDHQPEFVVTSPIQESAGLGLSSGECHF